MARSSGCCLSSATRHRRICVEWGHLLQTGAGVAASIRLALCKHHRAAAIPVAADPCSNCKDRPARRSDRCWDTVGLRRRPGREIAPCASASSPHCPCCCSQVTHSPSSSTVSTSPHRWFRPTRSRRVVRHARQPGDRCSTFRSRGAAGSLRNRDPLIDLRHRNSTRPHPIAILNWHGGANRTLEDMPLVISSCPLCGAGTAFLASSGGRTLRIGVAGLLCTSDVLRHDRETEPHGRHCLL